MCPSTFIIGVEFSLIASCVTRRLIELRISARTEMRRSGAGVGRVDGYTDWWQCWIQQSWSLIY
jgi:hypothetical protein